MASITNDWIETMTKHIRKILVMGLPGAGKTTFSKALAKRLGAVHFNADEVRAAVNKDLGFSVEDRIEQARRMGFLADTVAASGTFAIADFVCPTDETREAFFEGGQGFTILIDRIEAGRFEDTNRLFVRPAEPEFIVNAAGTPEFWAERFAEIIVPRFDFNAPTAFLLGRYQPWHDGHKALFEEALERVGQVVIAVRSTYDPTPGSKDPFEFDEVAARIKTALRGYEGRFEVMPVPNVTNIFYGRDVGYSIERIDLDEATKAISATAVRKKLSGE